MSKWLRRIRGAIGMGLTWAAGWAPLGALVGAVLDAVLPGASIGLGTVVALNAITFAGLGFVGGTLFAVVLRWAEGGNKFNQLSLRRFAVLGAAGGALLGGFAVTAGLWGAGMGALLPGMIGAATLLGAGSAAGSLALARRAGDRELTEGESAASPTSPERHELLGRRS